MPLCGQKNVSSSKNKNINTNYCHSGIIKGWDKASVLFVLVNESLKNLRCVYVQAKAVCKNIQTFCKVANWTWQTIMTHQENSYN